MQIFVRTATGKVITIDCDGPTEKIFGVKEKVLDRTGLAVSAQALLFAGKALLDEDTLGAKGIVAETTLFLVEKIEKEALPSWGCRVCGTLNQGEASECEICWRLHRNLVPNDVDRTRQNACLLDNCI